MSKYVEEKKQETAESELEKLLSEVQDHETKNMDVHVEQQQPREIDVLNLPPRREVHGQNKKRAHLKFSKPFLRLVLVMVVLLGVMIGAFYLWGNELLEVFNNLK